jgi:hypothetical protein
MEIILGLAISLFVLSLTTSLFALAVATVVSYRRQHNHAARVGNAGAQLQRVG